jgi:hypothetical protein
MSVQVGNLHLKSIVRDLNGQIINLRDDSNGGWIIRNRQIVNPERWEELQKIERDKQEAAKAITLQKVEKNAPDRNTAPSKVDALEKRVEGMESKLDLILAALKK